MNLRREDLVKRRKAVEKTQQEVADALGVSARTVQRWELGESIPELDPFQFWTLCELYKCTAKDLARDFFPEKFSNQQ